MFEAVRLYPNILSFVINGVALGGLGVAMPGSVNPARLSGETGGAFGAAGKSCGHCSRPPPKREVDLRKRHDDV